jgi:hypothetical protein
MFANYRIARSAISSLALLAAWAAVIPAQAAPDLDGRPAGAV